MNPMYSGHYTFERPTNLSTGRSRMITFADRKGGFPHSEIFGSKGARASPKLIAACHVLHRLSTPRHPSEALMRLIVLSKTHAWTIRPDQVPPQSEPSHMRFVSCQTMMSSQVRPSSTLERAGTDPSFTMSDRRRGREPGRKLVFSSIARELDGGARRDRTDDLMLAKHALYQLSYGPLSRAALSESWSSIDLSARGVARKCGRPGQTRTADLTLIRRVL